MSSDTFYSILGVDKSADQATIRKAYLKLSLKYHPDKNPGNEELAKEEFVKIGAAYEVLSDPSSRSAYDRDLASGRQQHQQANSTSYAAGHADTTEDYQRPSKTYETYREAFDDHVAHMSEDELRAAMGTAAIIGGLVGSLLGSGLARKAAGNNKLVGALFETAGSFLGSTVGSEAGVGIVRNAHVQSRDRITYEERKRFAMERGEPIPEAPKEGWSDLRDNLSKTMNSVKDQVQGTSQPSTARGQAFHGIFGAVRGAKKKMDENKGQKQDYR
jgi:curved DNA-binding protein CbpA